MNEADQKTAIVTGASAGIGKSTARMLAEAGWRVIGIGRDPARSVAAEAELRAAAPGAKIDFLRGDFCEMRDVRRVAAEVKTLTSRVDVLINNAGGVRDGIYTTAEGLEATFAANHLAAFLFTREVLPLLEATAATAPAGSVRVIAVSSSGHQMCQGMNWEDLNMFGGPAVAAYCQAKLANLLFTRELARRVGASGIVAQSIHPGTVRSNFASHGNADMQSYMEANAKDLPDKPAETLVWMATAPEAGNPPARYFYDKQAIDTAPQAKNDTAALRLWQESEKILHKILS
jgi:NAD(P)-dependent dehydrogenase (short-subunit alcohol dehydrogenase family)